ncbi:MAG: hypothetical protein QXT81_00745 [Candidatus Bathyarchaeia archaeon]
MPAYVTINPYRLESLNTMRFIEDLSHYYSMLALSDGEISYRVDSRLISKVCRWIRKTYTYAFVLGYSTGGIALAYELTMPEGADSGPDGAVVMTAMVNWKEMVEKHKTSSGVELYASALRSRNVRESILLMYGEKAWFWHQGEEYYRNLPEEGWRGKRWFQKEWRLISGAEHEVFTIEDTGCYDLTAFTFVVDFLERVRASSLKSLESIVPESLRRYSVNDSATGIHTLKTSHPEAVRRLELFFINLTLPKVKEGGSRVVALYDLDKRSFVTISKTSLEEGLVSLPAVLSLDESARRFVGLEIIYDGGQPRIIGLSPTIRIELVDKFPVRIETGVRSLQIEIDGQAFTTGIGGWLTVYLEEGNHTLTLPETVTLSGDQRLMLTTVEDGPSKNPVIIYVNRDLVIKVRYREQYLLTVNSEHGSLQGAGWHDVNSTATVTLNLDLDAARGKETPIFAGWSDSRSDRSLSRQVFMDSPKTLTAEWASPRSYEVSVWPWAMASAIFSTFTFAVYVSIMYRACRSRGRSP